jgi:hypothetical protein
MLQKDHRIQIRNKTKCPELLRFKVLNILLKSKYNQKNHSPFTIALQQPDKSSAKCLIENRINDRIDG